MLEALIAAGADVRQPDKDGWTPLMWTAEKDRELCADVLLQAGADPHDTCNDGESAMLKASERGNSSVAHSLYRLGLVDVDRTVLSSAKANRHAYFVREMSRLGSHLEDPDLRPALDKLRETFGTIWEVDDLTLRIKLISQGMGISYFDCKILEQRTECKGFTQLHALPFSEIPLTFGLFSRRNSHLSAGARQFIQICKIYDFY